MQFATVDMICRRWLLDRNLPIHFYAEALFHTSTCLRELTKRTLKIINTANLPVDEHGMVNLPGDFVDDICLSLDGGLVLKNIPHKTNINPLRVHDATTGAFVSQPTAQDEGVETGIFFGSGAFFFWNIDAWGTSTGRFFGANGGTPSGYQVFKERRQIQLAEGFQNGNVILQYISNGQSSDNASQVDWQAFRTITSFIDWQRSPRATDKDSPEAKTFQNEERLLRSSLNPLTVADIRNIVLNAYTASVKN
jgi:hypothetical protein